MNEMNEWLRRTSEANLLTGKEQKNIKEAIATLDLIPLTQYAIADLCDAIYKLGQHTNSDVKPESIKRNNNMITAKQMYEIAFNVAEECEKDDKEFKDLSLKIEKRAKQGGFYIDVQSISEENINRLQSLGFNVEEFVNDPTRIHISWYND